MPVGAWGALFEEILLEVVEVSVVELGETPGELTVLDFPFNERVGLLQEVLARLV